MRPRLNFWIAFTLLLSGCQFRPLGFLATPTSTPEPAPAPVATRAEPTPFPTLAPQGCQTVPDMWEGEWTPVQDTNIGFSFETPARWQPDTSLGSDLILLSSQPADPASDGLICGTVTMELRADGIGSWVGWIPEPEAMEVTVGPQQLSAHRVDEEGSGRDGEFGLRTEVYVVGGGYFYFLTFEYFPQPGISEVDYQRDARAFEDIVERVLGSFTVRL